MSVYDCQLRSSNLVTVSATAALSSERIRNTRIRRQWPFTDKINSSPMAGTSRFSSVIACSPLQRGEQCARSEPESSQAAAASWRDPTNRYSSSGRTYGRIEALAELD